MPPEKVRQVALWQPQVRWQSRPDGSLLVWQEGTLPPYPPRLSDRIAHWAEATPEVTWMAERGPDGGWRGSSYATLHDRSRAIGQALLDLSLSPERPLIILSGNSIAHALVAYGAQHVGVPSAAVAPDYALQSSSFDKLHAIAAQITPGAVFAEDLGPFAAAIEAVFPGLPRLGVTGAHDIAWDELTRTRPTEAVAAANAATGPETVAKFMFTSGTTGSPKAVIQTQRMLCANMAMVADCFAWLADEPPVLVDWAPWNHVASGNKATHMAMWHGGTYYIDAGKPTPAAIGETIRNLKSVSPTWYFNVPAGYEMLVEAMRGDPDLAASFFSRLKMMFYAGASMADHTWRELDRLAVAATGERVLLATGLGATETAPAALFCVTPQEQAGNVGIPSKELVLKLVPTDGKWEARLKGPSVTPGYWRNEPLTEAAFDDEGFYNLGDALRFADRDDPAKGFYFDGRTAENFKLSTGTWVGVGPLRAALTDALGGLVRDVVIAGEGRPGLGALLVPFRPALERLVAGGADLAEPELLARPEVRAAVAERLCAHNRAAEGSSMRVGRALFLDAPLDLDRGEVTDKGSVNQRAVLRHRPALVEALFSDDPRVIAAD